ncbi:hypothetical protein CYMTET_33456 [Cymbomonas tetramitiformis]|uniref:Uncharacterized protein n=1 Tax=Cymbomonas tetramitiformis TaxID=36881 RepID=A0AAE0FCZ8_9CHLO|nr:hypothetical protein CYMTET_33456 [Cymbomonas tetramitiformis]
MWIDNPQETGVFWMTVFPSLQGVKKYIFHVINNITRTVDKAAACFGDFARALSTNLFRGPKEKRWVPRPDSLKSDIQSVHDDYDTRQNETKGTRFFSPETAGMFKRTLELADGDFLFDSWFREIRSTSQLEGLHHHDRSVMHGANLRPDLGDCLFFLFYFRWNVDRMVELMSSTYRGMQMGHYDYELIENIQATRPFVILCHCDLTMVVQI